MATYYCNLSLAGTVGAGTTGDPWSGARLKVNTNGTGVMISGDKVRLKGSWSTSGTWTIALSNITFDSWESTPWRITSTGRFQGADGLVAKNGIMRSTNAVGVSFINEMINCFIIAPTYRTGFVNSVIKGSTIVATTSFTNDGGALALSIVDSIIDSPTLNFDSVNSSNCVYTAASIPGGGVHTNSQVSWTAPTWPTWDAVQSAFDYTVLSSGINTPPEPGNPPYTGYAVGLWNSLRSGIGALDFLTPGPTTTTTTTTAAPTTTTTTAAPTTTTTTAAPTTTTTTAAPTTTTTTAAPTTTTTTAAPTTTTTTTTTTAAPTTTTTTTTAAPTTTTTTAAPTTTTTTTAAPTTTTTTTPAPSIYTVTYSGNGNTEGMAPVDGSSPYNPGDTVTVLDGDGLLKKDHVFGPWNTAANGSGTSYLPGATFGITQNTVLYMQWQAKDKKAPKPDRKGATRKFGHDGQFLDFHAVDNQVNWISGS